MPYILAGLWVAGDLPDVGGLLLQYGPLGVMVILLVVGWLIPKGAYETLRADRDEWRAACRDEQHAHQLTRDALAQANARAEVGMEAGITATRILKHLEQPQPGAGVRSPT